MKLSRREFVKSGSLAAMLSMLAPSLLLDRATKEGCVKEVIKGSNILRINSKDVGILNSMSTNMSRDMIDVTDPLEETASYRGFMAGFKTSEVNLSLVSTPRTVLALEGDLENTEPKSFEIIMKDTKFAFDGYITSTQSSAKEIVATVMIDSSVMMT